VLGGVEHRLGAPEVRADSLHLRSEDELVLVGYRPRVVALDAPAQPLDDLLLRQTSRSPRGPSWGRNRIDVFARRHDNRVWQNSFDNGH
jgi:hypothetical protein